MKALLAFGVVSISVLGFSLTGLAQKAKHSAKKASKKEAVKYTTDPKTGVRYHFFKHDKTKPTAGDKDVATVIMLYRNDLDSVVLDSRKRPRRPDDTIGTIMIPLMKTFKGCLEQGIEMMAVGDSAEFLINTDSLFTKTFHQKGLPPYAHKGTDLTFDVKLVKFQTQEEIKAEQQQLMVKKQMEAAQRKAEEPRVISKYLKDNNLNVQPTADSLYFLSRQNGGGKQIEEGDSIAINYTGMLLNGKVFDASSLHPKGQELLKMVYSKSMPLIKGWVLALATMREGDKVRILLSSSLAYGPRQASADILPYTPLIFDMEVVKVTPGK